MEFFILCALRGKNPKCAHEGGNVCVCVGGKTVGKSVTHRSCVSELAFFPFLRGCRDDFVGMETLADARMKDEIFSRPLKFAFPHLLFD